MFFVPISLARCHLSLGKAAPRTVSCTAPAQSPLLGPCQLLRQLDAAGWGAGPQQPQGQAPWGSESSSLSQNCNRAISSRFVFAALRYLRSSYEVPSMLQFLNIFTSAFMPGHGRAVAGSS